MSGLAFLTAKPSVCICGIDSQQVALVRRFHCERIRDVLCRVVLGFRGSGFRKDGLDGGWFLLACNILGVSIVG